MKILPSGQAPLDSRQPTAPGSASPFGLDKITLSAAGSWDYNWHSDANPQEDYARARRINDIRNELQQNESKQRENADKLQLLPNQIYQKEQERSAAVTRKDHLLAKNSELESEKYGCTCDRDRCRNGRAGGHRHPNGERGWDEEEYRINERIARIEERQRDIAWKIREAESKADSCTRDIDQLRSQQGQLQEENSRYHWYAVERVSEWKTLYSQLQSPTNDLYCPY